MGLSSKSVTALSHPEKTQLVLAFVELHARKLTAPSVAEPNTYNKQIINLCLTTKSSPQKVSP